MPRYVTRVSVWFYSEGASPAQVISKLTELGFKPVRGAYDFVYEHSDVDMTEADLSNAIIETSNALHKTLSGFKVLYNLDTHLSEGDEDYVPLEDIDAELEETRKELEEIENEEK
jgi:predicted nuclease with TOPRIM domain